MLRSSVDEILLDEERVQCVFLGDIEHLGFLDPNLEADMLPENSKVSLPLWLAKEFSDRGIVRIESPAFLGSKMQNEIASGSNTINFREFSPYFFELGLKISSIKNDPVLRRSLRTAYYRDRFSSIYGRCFTGGHQDVTEFMQTLTNSEQKTFLKGKSAHDDIEKWKSSSSFLLQPSSFVGKRMSDTKNFEDESKRKRA